MNVRALSAEGESWSIIFRITFGGPVNVFCGGTGCSFVAVLKAARLCVAEYSLDKVTLVQVETVQITQSRTLLNLHSPM